MRQSSFFLVILFFNLAAHAEPQVQQIIPQPLVDTTANPPRTIPDWYGGWKNAMDAAGLNPRLSLNGSRPDHILIGQKNGTFELVIAVDEKGLERAIFGYYSLRPVRDKADKVVRLAPEALSRNKSERSRSDRPPARGLSSLPVFSEEPPKTPPREEGTRRGAAVQSVSEEPMFSDPAPISPDNDTH